MNKKKKNIHRVDVDKLNCTLYKKKRTRELFQLERAKYDERFYYKNKIKFI